jgi:hypothetical protein
VARRGVGSDSAVSRLVDPKQAPEREDANPDAPTGVAACPLRQRCHRGARGGNAEILDRRSWTFRNLARVSLLLELGRLARNPLDYEGAYAAIE